MTPRASLILVLALLGVALALRLGAAFLVPRLGGDSELYLQLGRNILEHGTLGVAGPDGVVQPTVAREPGYPLFLALVLALGPDSATAVGIAQALLSVGVCWLAFLLTARLTRSPAWGLAALALCAVNPYLVRFSATVLTETLAGAFMVGAVALLVLPRPAPRPLLGAGMALGALTLTRVQYGLLILAFGAVYLLCVDRSARRLAGYAALGFVMVMLPWWVRNYVAFGRIILAKSRFVQVEVSPTLQPVGYHAWFNTWMEREDDIARWLWRVEPRLDLLPEQAAPEPSEQQVLEDLFARMRSRGSGVPVENLVTPAEDRVFAALAERRRAAEAPAVALGRTFRRYVHLWVDLPLHYSPMSPVLPDAASIRERGVLREARRGAVVALFLSHHPLSLLALIGCTAVRRERRWLYAVAAVGYATVIHTLLQALEARCLILVYPLLIMLAVAGAAEAGRLLRNLWPGAAHATMGPNSIDPPGGREARPPRVAG